MTDAERVAREIVREHGSPVCCCFEKDEQNNWKPCKDCATLIGAIAAALAAPRGGDATFAEQKTPVSVPTTELPEASIPPAPSTVSDAAPSSSASGGGARCPSCQREYTALRFSLGAGWLCNHCEPKPAPSGGGALPIQAKSSPSMDDDRLRAIAERVEKATPGPWFWDSYSRIFTGAQTGWTEDDDDWWEMRKGERRVPYPGNGPRTMAELDPAGQKQLCDYWMNYALAAIYYQRDPLIASVPALSGDTASYNRSADAAFIAAAREDIPYLLSVIATLQARPTPRGPDESDYFYPRAE